jgi:DNA polymerase III delta prime subunit
MEAAIAHQEGNVQKLLRIAKDLALPHEAVTQTFGILGKRGSGKTTTASVLAEQLLKSGLPLVIVDPTDAWWGLRSSKDGKSDGYPITVLGGDHGDAPLEETAGRPIADLVAEEAPPLVLSLRHLSDSAMRRFMLDFARRLYEKNRTALHVILDEADEFAPQTIPPEGRPLFGAIDRIVRRGRSSGLGMTMVSQRSAVLNKSILSQCEVLIAHRASHPTDIEPVLKWMEVHARDRIQEVHQSIAHLADGEAWVMSPEWLSFFGRLQMDDRTTFNSSATPKPGERRIVPKRLAEVDLKALQARMAETIERAKAADPALLRRRIAELERELARKPAVAAIPPAKVKEVPALREKDLNRLQRAALDFSLESGNNVLADIEDATKNLDRACERVAKALREGREVADALRAAMRPGTPPPAAPRPAPIPRPAARAPSGLNHGAGEDSESPNGLSAYAVGLLRTLAERQPMKLTQGQLAALSGRSARSSAFQAAMAELRRERCVATEGSHVVITDVGLAAAGDVRAAVPTTPEEMKTAWLRVLPEYERDLAAVLFEAYPQVLSDEDLGARAQKSPTSSMFQASMASLRRNGIAERVDGGNRASDAVFPGGA